MKIKAPDYAETHTEEISDIDLLIKESKKPLQDEIKEIMQLPKPLSMFIPTSSNNDNSEAKLQVLLKYLEFCREEVIPRHTKAVETLQSRSDSLQYQLTCQQKELAHLISMKQTLKDSLDQLNVKRVEAQTKDHQLNERLKETLKKLQDCCKNKTLAERKMGRELRTFDTKSKDLRVKLTGTKANVNYFSSQVEAQTNMIYKQSKPLYLDKTRTVFLRSNLNTMRQNIEDLVQRVKIMKEKSSELTESLDNTLS